MKSGGTCNDRGCLKSHAKTSDSKISAKSVKKCRFVDEDASHESDRSGKEMREVVDESSNDDVQYTQKRSSSVSSTSECCCCKKGCPVSTKDDSNYEKIIHEKSEPIVTRPPPLRSSAVMASGKPLVNKGYVPDHVIYSGPTPYTRSNRPGLYSSNHRINHRPPNLFRSMNNNHSISNLKHAHYHKDFHTTSNHKRTHSHSCAYSHSHNHSHNYSHNHSHSHNRPPQQSPSVPASRRLRCLVEEEADGCYYGRKTRLSPVILR